MPAEGTDDSALDLVELEAALVELSELDQRLCSVVELRYLAGMTNREAGDALGVSERTVRLDWAMARAWLQGKLEVADD